MGYLKKTLAINLDHRFSILIGKNDIIGEIDGFTPHEVIKVRVTGNARGPVLWKGKRAVVVPTTLGDLYVSTDTKVYVVSG